ncbi:hypothetical protein SAMN05660964_03825 [Thiothrix caldifontis]|uniref:Uncharacterized protein n=1 Tax=Thiothrix caldifontis TaxID=525918 RepID=A0A1H4H0L1_9GAMM|nr:hypothetical protein [Thiothrix caldifontis]SEB14860.1 hypothetical protein SAMN05660964_03825 [Thiothrix caldifontis]
MFTSIKNFFKSAYEFMSSKITGAYVRVNDWLVDKLTGEILDELDVNPTFWNAVYRAGRIALLGKRDSSIKESVIRNATVALVAISGGALAAGVFQMTLSSGFMIAVASIYGALFVFNLALELIRNHMIKEVNAVMGNFEDFATE